MFYSFNIIFFRKNMYIISCKLQGNFNENITDGKKNNQVLLICVKIRKYQQVYYLNYFIFFINIYVI